MYKNLQNLRRKKKEANEVLDIPSRRHWENANLVNGCGGVLGKVVLRVKLDLLI
jgi:hypothetical protein